MFPALENLREERRNALAILGSARKDGNTAAVLHRLLAGGRCDVVDLQASLVTPYCYESCYPEGDQFLSIVERIVRAPLTIIATPVYWYSYSTPMKVFIDRFSDLISVRRELGRRLRGQQFALVSSSAEPWPDKTLVEAFSRFCDYLGIRFIGCAHSQGSGECVDPAIVARIRAHL